MKDKLRQFAMPSLAIITIIFAIIYSFSKPKENTSEEEYKILTENLCSVALEITEKSPHIINIDDKEVGNFKYVNFETLHAYGLMNESENIIPIYIENPFKTSKDESIYYSENHKLKLIVNSENKIICEGIVDAGNPPEITLIGGNDVTISKGTAYEEPGYNAKDEEDGDITSKVIKNGIVDYKKEGKYTLLYFVKDKDGNKTTKQRIVTVK